MIFSIFNKPCSIRKSELTNFLMNVKYLFDYPHLLFYCMYCCRMGGIQEKFLQFMLGK